MKILNLYAGIGGNRKLWGDEHEVTAVENNPEIAKIYKDFFPKDKVIVGDAHEYLLEHFEEFDFIWSSPPCPTHSRIRTLWAADHKDKVKIMYYPDMKLYEEIIFLKHFFKGKWVVENVISYYEPLIKPFPCENHYFWANFTITNKPRRKRSITRNNKKEKWGFNLVNKGLQEKFRTKLLNNLVHPELGLHIFNCAFKTRQETL